MSGNKSTITANILTDFITRSINSFFKLFDMAISTLGNIKLDPKKSDAKTIKASSSEEAALINYCKRFNVSPIAGVEADALDEIIKSGKYICSKNVLKNYIGYKIKTNTESSESDVSGKASIVSTSIVYASKDSTKSDNPYLLLLEVYIDGIPSPIYSAQPLLVIPPDVNKALNLWKECCNNIDKYIKSTYGNNVEVAYSQATQASKKLSATLQKITGANTTDVSLVSVMSDYNATESLDILNSLCDSELFIDNINETPTSFVIQDIGDEFDVTPTEYVEPDVADSYNKILAANYDLLCTAQMIHWNAVGENFYELHSTAENITYALLEELDTLAELCVEYTNCVEHPAHNIYNNQVYSGFTRTEGYEILKQGIRDYVNTLDLYYCNFDKDVQSLLDDWIRDWKKTANYKLSRTEDSSN